MITSQITSVDPLEFTKGAHPATYEVAIISTDNPACPIESYAVTALVSGITQPGCPSPADSSDACRKVSVDRSVVQDYSPITFTATAKGGKTKISS